MAEPWHNWLLIGIAGAPFGVTGEIKVHPETDFPERFAPGRQVFVRFAGSSEPQERTLKTVRWHKGDALARFEDCAGRNDAERYRGAEILIPAAERMNLPKGQYYLSDLMGMDVWLEEGRFLGKIENVLQYAANDVYVVGKILIPAIRDVVLEVDVPGKRMVVRHLPGLLPEDADES